MRAAILTLLALAAVSFPAVAQTPIVVQAADSTPQAQTVATQPLAPADSASTLKMLQEMKTQNEETLKKQQAALDAIDAMQKEADQIRIFSKRN